MLCKEEYIDFSKIILHCSITIVCGRTKDQLMPEAETVHTASLTAFLRAASRNLADHGRTFLPHYVLKSNWFLLIRQ